MGNHKAAIRRKAAEICQWKLVFSEIFSLLTAAFAFEGLFLCGQWGLCARQGNLFPE